MVSSEAVQAMKKMAEDVKKRAVLVKDATCIGGLVLVLSNKDTDVVKLALETVLLLADSPENRPILRDFIGMTDQLESVMSRNDNEEISTLAKTVYDTLTEVAPLRDGGTTSCNTSCTSRRSSLQKALHGGHKASKTLILQLRGLLNKCDRDVCMRLLLQVKGVISITFDMNKKRCILRTKTEVRPESLVQAVARTQSIYAQQVIKTESGGELFLSFGNNHKSLDKENDSHLPDYLPDDEEMPEIDDKAIARNKKDSTSGGWLSTAASFLTNSFYW